MQYFMMHAASVCLIAGAGAAERQVPVDLAGYSADCGVAVRREANQLVLTWPMEAAEQGRVVLNLAAHQPVIDSLSVSSAQGTFQPVLEKLDPVTFLTAGTRKAPGGRPPQMSIWNVFFDSPAKRPHQTHRARLEPSTARVTSRGQRATVSVDRLVVGPFAGELQFTVYAGGRLLHVEAVVSTEEDERAILYDAGLVGAMPRDASIAWLDTAGRLERVRVDLEAMDRAVAVRHRTIVLETGRGSVASFPPPHEFFFPRDLSDNLRYVWTGRRHHGGTDPFGFGVRQSPEGGGGFVPWFNAPPGTRQRLGLFYLLSGGNAEQAIEQTLRYTRGDRFSPLPGHITLTSHWHMAVAVTAMAHAAQGRNPLPVPDLVQVFKDMGVNAVHLAEFHGDGHQKDPGPLRLPELEAMFSECRRLSDDDLLVIPGEEVNDFLGIKQPGKHPGHWMSLFPKPVYWVMQRATGEPVAEPHPQYGTLYRVGSREDMVQLLERERGLVWAAHPRIKASSWTPDIFRHEHFYRSDFWLGGAWKAMPADLSHPRLGQRALDLLDDMANWGDKKYLLGEVDVFKIDRTHELYGHMNINYVRLDRLPRFDEGWQPVLDALRGGRFFVTTGELLIREFSVAGKEPGELAARVDPYRPEVRITLDWTFPLQFAELISGDGQNVYRERIDLADTRPFDSRTLTLSPDLSGRRWVRLEAWDVARNGAFTQPVWLVAR